MLRRRHRPQDRPERGPLRFAKAFRDRTGSLPRELVFNSRHMVIENAIAESIDFFHMDALSSAVPLKIDADLQFPLMASTLYRLPAAAWARAARPFHSSATNPGSS
ncbi:MAG: hypothetical protein OXC19_07960 [Bryobacterales bacterium]|nr:hypothetical protein [Bryobacterales bacterium]